MKSTGEGNYEMHEEFLRGSSRIAKAKLDCKEVIENRVGRVNQSNDVKRS